MKDLSFKAMTEFASKVKHSGLTQREKDILLMRVGYNQDKPMSLQQIANAISDYKQENKHNNYTDTKYSRERIRQLEEKALAKLGINKSYAKDYKIGTLRRKHDADVKRYLEQISPMRFQTERPFSEIAKMIGVNYNEPAFKEAVKLFYKKFRKEYPNSKNIITVNNRVKRMFQIKEDNPWMTQGQLAKATGFGYSSYVSMIYRVKGRKWTQGSRKPRPKISS
tara:strand:+ start:957 stop:1625 length:669 start_codon:yes stop_codon:yes gene_type:complete